MVGAFVCNPDIVTTEMLFRHSDYTVDRLGIDHVGFGSNFIPDIIQTAIAIQTPAGQEMFPHGSYSGVMRGKRHADTGSLPNRGCSGRQNAGEGLLQSELEQISPSQSLSDNSEAMEIIN